MVTYFENLTVKLDILYVFNIHVKFYVNQVLFTIRFIYIHPNELLSTKTKESRINES